MTSLRLPTLAAVAGLALVTACSSSPTRSVTDSSPAYGSSAYTNQMGSVTQIELVDAQQRPGLGAILGGVIGAAVGNQVGSGSGRAAATGAGAIGGAVVGHQVEKRNSADVYRVTVRFDNGGTRAFHFEQVGALRVGDRVRYDGSQLYRI